jgi:hypothetical protein
LEVIGSTKAWHFVVDQSSETVGAIKITATGNIAFDAYVPTYKGTLVYVERVRAWVLFSDHRHTRPVAVCGQLPAVLATAVQEHLPDSKRRFFELSDEDLETVTRLIETS